MSSILRSSKFFRYVAGFAKNVVASTPKESDGNFVNANTNIHHSCSSVSRLLGTQATTSFDQNSHRKLRSLEQDVKKSGRVSKRDIEDVLDEIRGSRATSISQSLTVISCCGNLVPDELPEVRTKLVKEVWATLDKLNVPMGVMHFNALLKVYLENEHSFSPTEFLADMKNKGVEPNRVTYQRLISRYCQDGDIEGATKILEFMREKEMPVNENVFNALIVGHSRIGDMESAHGILGVMGQAGLEPTADTYTTLLCGYATKGDIKKINDIFTECEQKEIYLLDKDYLNIVYSLATNNHNQYIQEILKYIKKSFGYSQDAISLILRLINKGNEFAAFEVLKTVPRSTLPDGSLMPVGTFFIRQLIKADKPLNIVLDYCNKLQEEQLFNNSLLLATETCLRHGKVNLCYDLFEELRKNGCEIKQHYFWPLILTKAQESNDGRGILEVLHKMQDLGVTVTNETIREYVLPNLNLKTSEILAFLREANLSLGSSVGSIIINLLHKKEISEAAIIASGIKAYYNPDLLRKPLTNAFYATKDIDSYISLLRTIHDNLPNIKNVYDNENVVVPDATEVIGSFILNLTSASNNFQNILPLVLHKLIDQGISISNSCAERIESRLGEKMTDEISELLGKLTSGDLIPIPLPTSKPVYTPYTQMTIAQLERLIQNLAAKNQDSIAIKRHLFTLYYRDKNIIKMEELLSDLKANPKFERPIGMNIQLMDAYVSHNKLDEAIKQFNMIKDSEKENFILSDLKIIRLAGLLFKNGKLDDGIKLLEETPKDSNGITNYSYTSELWRLLNYFAEDGNVESLTKVFDILINKGYANINNIILGPLIKVHIINKDIDAALNKFEWCVNQYKLTPWKNELTCKLIQMEDAEKLQKLTDLSSLIHGEINSLYDLVFAFVECGRVRQARKILETPGLVNRQNKIANACERFQQEGLAEPLEGLRDATKDLHYIDRNDIYYQLLLTYIKQDEPEKCLALWTQMQEEDLPPSNQLLIKLGSFLQEKGIQVPFDIPHPQIQQREQRSVTKEVLAMPNSFKQHFKNGNIKACLNSLKTNNTTLSNNDVSLLIEKCLQDGRIDDAKQATFYLLDKGNYPTLKVFRYFLNQVASKGDLVTMERVGANLSEDMKKLLSFDNRLCHANITAGKTEEYLTKLENSIDNCTPETLQLVEHQFPRGGAYGILDSNPELINKFEEIAIKYANKGIYGPVNVLWSKYFIDKNSVKEDEIWNNYLKDAPRLMFQKIVHVAREKQDETLVENLIEHLKNCAATEGAIGNAYSCYIDILVAKNKNEEAVEIFEKAVTTIDINNVNRTAVVRMKDVYGKLGKAFNFTIPAKNKVNYEEQDKEAVL